MKNCKVIAILIIGISLLLCACDEQSSLLLVDYNRDAGLFRLDENKLKLDLSKTSPSDLTDIIIPIKVNGEEVTELSEDLFKDCENLKSLRVNGMIKELGFSVLDGCTALETLILDNGVETIAPGALGTCESLSLLWSLSQAVPITVSVDDLMFSPSINVKGNFNVVNED